MWRSGLALAWKEQRAMRRPPSAGGRGGAARAQQQPMGKAGCRGLSVLPSCSCHARGPAIPCIAPASGARAGPRLSSPRGALAANPAAWRSSRCA